MTEGLMWGILIISLFLGLSAFLVACLCYAKVVGLENSTHQVQMVPMNESNLESENFGVNYNDLTAGGGIEPTPGIQPTEEDENLIAEAEKKFKEKTRAMWRKGLGLDREDVIT